MDKRKNKENLDKTMIHRPILNDKVLNELDRRHTIMPRKKPTIKKAHPSSNRQYNPFEEETFYDNSHRHRPKTNKKSYVAFYITTFSIAVLVCLAVFIYAFKTVLSPGINLNPFTDLSPVINNDSYQLPDDTTTPIVDEVLSSLTGLVTEFNYQEKRISILDIDKNVSNTFVVNENTVFSTDSGRLIVFAEVKPGDIVTAQFQENNFFIKQIIKSNSNFFFRNITGVVANETNNTFLYNDNEYVYDDNLISPFSEEYPISNLSTKDTVNLYGYNGTIYRIDVIVGHGTISFINAESIINGKVEINTDTFFNLSTQTKVELSTGNHHILVKGDNLDLYVSDIVLQQGEDIEIDLSNMTRKKSNIIINTNVKAPTLLINNIVYNLDAPIHLPFDTYAMQLTAEGYEPLSQSILVDKVTTVVNFNLVKSMENATLVINSTPEGATVYVDSVFLGTTPFSYDLSLGEHVLILSKDGYYTMEQLLLLDEDKVYPYLFELKEDLTIIFDDENID